MEMDIDNTLPKNMRLILSSIKFKNSKTNKVLWEERIYPLMNTIETTMTVEYLASNETVQATKAAYRELGLDPSRYRPSSDSLLRRVMKGKGLYQINALVDFNNYLSMKFSLPVGSYDRSKLKGAVTYRCGQAGEEYEGIGKGTITVEKFPLLCDELGPFASPISDSVRASISTDTSEALLVVYSFNQTESELETIRNEVKKQIEEVFAEAIVYEQKIV